MEETSYFTGAVTTPTQLPGLTVCGAPAPEPAPAVVTKNTNGLWETEDTYVTLTYTNPDGTTGLSDYYGALGSQYIFCARQNSYSEPWYHNLNGRMPRSTSPCTCTSTSTSQPEPEPTPTTQSTDCYFSTYSSRWYYKHYRRRT
jgi:hypothetical protein